jgi:hypothetical protein
MPALYYRIFWARQTFDIGTFYAQFLKLTGQLKRGQASKELTEIFKTANELFSTRSTNCFKSLGGVSVFVLASLTEHKSITTH